VLYLRTAEQEWTGTRSRPDLAISPFPNRGAIPFVHASRFWVSPEPARGMNGAESGRGQEHLMRCLKKVIFLPACIIFSAVFAFTAVAQQNDPEINDKVRELQEQWQKIMKDEYNPSAIQPKTNGGPSFNSNKTWMGSSKKRAKKKSGAQAKSSKKGAKGKTAAKGSSKGKLASKKDVSKSKGGASGKSTKSASKTGAKTSSAQKSAKASTAKKQEKDGSAKTSPMKPDNKAKVTKSSPKQSEKAGGAKGPGKKSDAKKGATKPKSSKSSSDIKDKKKSQKN
jgi:hypothetical protein